MVLISVIENTASTVIKHLSNSVTVKCKCLHFSFVTVINHECRNKFSLLMLLLQSTRGHQCSRQSTSSATKTLDLTSYTTEFTSKTEDNCTDIELPQTNKGFKNIFVNFLLIYRKLNHCSSEFVAHMEHCPRDRIHNTSRNPSHWTFSFWEMT